MKNLLTIALFSMLTIVSCQKDDSIEEQNSFLNMPVPEVPNEQYALNAEIVSQTETEENGILCTVYEEAISATNTEFLPNNFEDKYPGQIFRSGNDIASSAWNPLLGGVRNGLHVTVVGPTVDQSSFFMDNPSLHEFNDILNEYKQQEVLMDADAQFSYKIIDVKSIEQLKLEIGADLKVGKWVDISSAIENSEIEEYSYFVVEMIQNHASVNISLPNSPDELYSEFPNVEQMGSWSPLMLTGTNYGRAAYFILKSSYSKQEAKLAIDAGFKFWGKVEINADLDSEEQEIINSMEINAVIYGGAQEPALSTVSGVDGIMDYITSGFIDNNAFGVPLGYKFKYISDFSDAKVVSNLVYTYRDCTESEEELEEINFNIPSIYGLCAEWIAGDREFNGNGPAQTATAELYYENNNSELWLRINFRLLETGSSVTEGVGYLEQKVYTAPSGYTISNINSDVASSCNQEDTDHTINHINLGQSELVERFEIQGDTNGNDLPSESFEGDCTEDYSYMNVIFNPVSITITRE